ncbi:MAG: glucokinase [Burkholderiales bacterium]
MNLTPASIPPVAAYSLPRLVADIGGTHARFGLVEGPGLSLTQVQRLRTEDYPHLIDAVRAYLSTLPTAMDRPALACLAVAAPLDGDEVRFINHPWWFSRDAVQRELGLDRLILLNDFEALALALPHLAGTGLRSQGAAPGQAAAPRGTLAVVGPGTGLGVAGLIHTSAGWQAIPGEGGHVTLAACDDFEATVLAAARRELAHVSAERLLSGVGLPLLHRAVATASGRSIDVAMRTEAILQHGIDYAGGRSGDADCARTLTVFCAMLGTVAGNVALTLGARGGLYIGGGIVPRMADLFFASTFRERFEAKGRYRDYMRAIPTALIIDPQAALTGAAVALEPVVATAGQA